MNDLDTQRIKIVEERLTKLEQKVNAISTPILDAIENFRRDTLSLFEGFALRLEAKMVESEARTAARLEQLEGRANKRFDELMAEIKKGRL